MVEIGPESGQGSGEWVRSGEGSGSEELGPGAEDGEGGSEVLEWPRNHVPGGDGDGSVGGGGWGGGWLWHCV